MAITYEATVQIRRDVHRVFAYLSDAPRWPEWAFSIRACQVEGGGPMRPGSRLQQKALLLGRLTDRSAQVTALEPEHHLAFAATMGPSPIRFGYRLTPVGAATHLTCWVECEPRSVMRPLAPLVRQMIRRVIDAELQKIKAAVEAEAAQGVTHPTRLS